VRPVVVEHHVDLELGMALGDQLQEGEELLMPVAVDDRP
jgi:hypothetical protein